MRISTIAFITVALVLPIKAGTGYELSSPNLGAPPQQISGGAYSLVGSATPGVTVPAAGGSYTSSLGPVLVAPNVSIVPGVTAIGVVVQGKNVILSWAADGVVLQTTTNLTPPVNWQPIALAAGLKTFTTNSTQSALFFRLH